MNNLFMLAQLIDGKALAATLKTTMRELVSKQRGLGCKQPCLAVILIGDDPASTIYVRNKNEACEQVGIRSIYHHLDPDISETDLISLINQLNLNQDVDGILVQLPLPAHIDAGNVQDCIDPRKDVDGFHPYNLGRLAQRRPLLRPCTPQGVMLLLEHINEACKGKHAVVVGASNIVGRPMALELLMAGATVTVCHRQTLDLAYFVKQADILVSAVGNPGLIQGAWIKPGAVVIDVGITRLADGSLTGDVDFKTAKDRAAWITPVPGGVGPMTVAVLLRNTLVAAGFL
jgi:methylenetetrahydrofolate dehydrogenase (NADP+)/methenyltetrahydrofolate cyclohydrolase